MAKMVRQHHTESDQLSRMYDVFISVVATLSIVPLMFKQQTYLLRMLDTITVYFLFMDYMILWMTYDIRRNKKHPWAFIQYPFTPLAVLDLLSLLPSLGLLGPTFRLFRMFRLVKVLEHSKNFMYVANVIKNQRRTLLSVLIVALTYTFISALALFVNEPDTFDSFFHAMYWAMTVLTTVGYGDVYPSSDIGRLISMLSSLFGVAIIALPAGIITGGFIEEMDKAKKEQERAEKEEKEKGLAKRFSFQLPKINITERVKRYGIVMGIGVLMNLVLYELARWLNLPMWLDTTGTVLAALLLEPAAGLMVGLINNLYLALFQFDNSTLIYYFTSATAAVLVGVLLMEKPPKPSRVAMTLGIAVSATSLIAALTTQLLMAGVPDVYWELRFFHAAQGLGLPSFLCTYIASLVDKSLDAVCSAILVYACYKLLPKSLTVNPKPLLKPNF